MGTDQPQVRAPAGQPGLEWTEPWLAWLDLVVHREILRLRGRYQLSADELRGLYISDAQVDAVLTEHFAAHGQPVSVNDWDTRADQLLDAALDVNGAAFLHAAGSTFGLGREQVAVLFVAFSVEVDTKYSLLFGYLNDDVTRRLPTVDLAQRLTGAGVAEFEPMGALLQPGLLHIVPAGEASAWRSAGLALAPSLRSFLLGASPDVLDAPEPAPSEEAERVAAALRADLVQTVVLECAPGGEPERLAVALSRAAGRTVVPSPQHPGAHDADTDLDQLLLTARLHGLAVYFPPTYFGLAGDDAPNPDDLRRLGRTLEHPVLKLIGTAQSGRHRSLFVQADHEVVRSTPGSPGTRRDQWDLELAAVGLTATPDTVNAIAHLFVLHSGQIRRAAAAARRHAPDGARSITLPRLAEQARAQSSSALAGLAQKVETSYSWSDLVLPNSTLAHLQQLAAAIRQRALVFDTWGFARLSAGSHSLRALFAGASGTGKTLAASVIANELGLPLYRIDLAAVVSKYIGETEKNLDRIFEAAEGSNAVLFFDEADALFGKRSEVKEAHDRYANIEVAYLLQRVESYDGVMMLASNLAVNLDEAFSRRLHFQVDFPIPDVAGRERLWRLLIPPEAPVDDDLDVAFLARRFPLTGGEVRNVALHAAFIAAEESTPIGMAHAIRALGRERTRQGRLPSKSEFQQYVELARLDGGPAEKG